MVELALLAALLVPVGLEEQEEILLLLIIQEYLLFRALF
jgi:hypothetical protein